jgi:alpha-N-arabinofuranosidase
MANLAQMVNVIAPIMTSKTGLFLQPIYFPIAEYAKQRGSTALDIWVSAPTYRIPNRTQEVQYLDVSATYRADRREIVLNVLNRSKDRDISTRIDNQEGILDGRMSVWQINQADLKTTHTFGDDRKVRPAVSSTTVTVDAGGFTYTFPAHSLTMLTMTLK